MSLEVTPETRYSHKIKIGLSTVVFVDSEERDEDYIIDHIAGKLCQFDIDDVNGELLFYKYNQGGYRNGMSCWFSYPAGTKTSLDYNSSSNEIAREFVRIYKDNKEN